MSKTENTIDVNEKINSIGQTLTEYKDKIVTLFKDMDVEIKDWRFVVEKMEKEYNLEAGIKLSIKPKD